MIARPIAGAIARPIAKRIANASHVYVYLFISYVGLFFVDEVDHSSSRFVPATRHPQPTTSRATLQAAERVAAKGLTAAYYEREKARNRALAWTPCGCEQRFRRTQMLAAMSGYSEERFSAGWLYDLDVVLHREGGIWETLGRAHGWPLGYQGEDGWVDWDEATKRYAGRQP